MNSPTGILFETYFKIQHGRPQETHTEGFGMARTVLRFKHPCVDFERV